MLCERLFILVGRADLQRVGRVVAMAAAETVGGHRQYRSGHDAASVQQHYPVHWPDKLRGTGAPSHAFWYRKAAERLIHTVGDELRRALPAADLPVAEPAALCGLDALELLDGDAARAGEPERGLGRRSGGVERRTERRPAPLDDVIRLPGENPGDQDCQTPRCRKPAIALTGIGPQQTGVLQRSAKGRCERHAETAQRFGRQLLGAELE